MKSTQLTFILFFLLQFLSAQKSDSTILIQNTKLTNIEKDDIVEINKIRKIVIQKVVVDAINHTSKLFSFLKLDLHKKLSDYYDDEDRLKEEVGKRLKKITLNNFLVEFISKEKNGEGSNAFSESYSFLVTFPFYYDYSQGYGYASSNYLIKIERTIKLNEKVNEKIGKFKFYPYKMIKLN